MIYKEYAIKARVNLEEADLNGAELPGANLLQARLWKAQLVGANLRGACLEQADLYKANLQGADLSHANLLDADLSFANLRDADLRGALLIGAGLRHARLEGAQLGETCLDPMKAANGDLGSMWETYKTRSGLQWVRGFRTARSTHIGNAEYERGVLHEAPVFSVSGTACHPGLYLWPTRERAEEWDLTFGFGVIEVWTAAHEIHKAYSKYRTRWLIS